MKKHVLHIFNSSVVSGPERLVFPALAHLNRSCPTHSASLVFLYETRLKSIASEDYANQLGLPFISIPVHSRLDWQAIAQLREQFKRADIIHAHDFKASVYSWLASKRKHGPPLVSTHHGVNARTGVKGHIYEWFFRYVLCHFDRIIAVSHYDEKVLQAYPKFQNKIRVQLNGITPNQNCLTQEQIRNSWKIDYPQIPLDQNPFVMGIVGRLSPEKRHDRALSVLAPLLNDTNWILLCFGSGKLEATLKEQASQLQLNERVFFTGFRATVSEEMLGLDLLLSFSDHEGLPINLLEAAWAGTPIFATAVGGIPDFINSNDFGTLVPVSLDNSDLAKRLRDCIKESIKGTSIREKAKKLQQHTQELFSQESWLKRLIEIYNEF